MALDLSTISQYFQYPSKVAELKDRLYNILKNKGIEVTASESLNSLIEKVREVEPALEPQTIYLTQNNTSYDVTEYTEAIVDVPPVTVENDLDGLVNGTLSSFTMPSQFTTLATERFKNFYDLPNVSVTQLTSIPEKTFYSCINLKEINATEVKTIGSSAFYNNFLISNILIPNAISIGEGAFKNCYSLGSYNNNSVFTIEDETFNNNFSLSYLSMSNVRTLNGTNTFGNCYNLSELNLPKLTVINDRTFKSENNLNKLEYISFPKLIIANTELPEKQLNTDITLNDLVSVSNGTGNNTSSDLNVAFINNYPNLSSINVNNLSYANINYIISGCSQLSELNLPNLQYLSGKLAKNLSNLENININYLSNIAAYTTSDLYLIDNCPNLKNIDMKYLITSIPAYFTRNNKLESVYLPYNYSTIRHNAFYNCNDISYVHIPYISLISDYAFYNCSNLTTIEDWNLNSVGSSAFYGCEKLSSISFEYSVSLGSKAFINCKNLNSIYLNTLLSTVSLNENDFINTPLLTSYYTGNYGSIYVHPNLLSAYKQKYSSTLLSDRFASFSSEYISNNIFPYQFQNSNITTIPESVKNAEFIHNNAFNNCRSLSKVQLSNVKHIGNSTFYCSSPLYSRQFDLPEVIDIGSYAFAGNSGKSLSINIPKCKKIGERAFSNIYDWNGINLSISMPEVEFIGPGAFRANSYISIISPNLSKLKYIGENAFVNTSQITVNSTILNLPELEFLGNGAFYYHASGMRGTNESGSAVSLTINMPKLKTVGVGAFYSAGPYLNSVLLSSVEYIYNNAFNNCPSLSTIGTNYYLKYIGSSAFNNCGNLTDNFNSPNLTYIGDSAFTNCKKITSMSFAECYNVGSYAFKGCTQLSDLYLPKLNQIESGLFSGCTNLTNLALDYENILSLPDNTFTECSKLTSLNLPMVMSLGNNVFDGCNNLSYINISIRQIPEATFRSCFNLEFDNLYLDRVTEIGSFAFDGCSKLSNFSNSYLVSLNSSVFANCTTLNTVNLSKVYMLEEGVFNNCYSLSDLNLNFSLISKIPNSTFYNCSNLSSFITSPNLNYIGSYAFGGCISLQSINLQKVEVINDYTFSNCHSLSSINLDNIKSIGTEAFANCDSLESINLNNIKSIKSAAFKNCSNLDIPLPDLSIIENEVFYNTNLKTISNSIVETIGENTFANCVNLSNINFENLQYIKSSAFRNNNKLSIVNIPNIASIEKEAFASTGLISIPSEIDNNLSSIPEGCFLGCSQLDTVILYHITNISDSAFFSCKNMSLLELNSISNMEDIGSSCFANCSNLKTVTMANLTDFTTGYISSGTYTDYTWIYTNKNIFKNCSNIEYLSLPECSILVNSINISNYGNLREAYLPKLEVLPSLFNNNYNLSKLNIDGILKLGDNNLSGCSALTEITLPNLKNLNIYTFCNCTNLSKINISNVYQAYTSTFYNCYKLSSLNLKYCNLSSYYNYTFYNCYELSTLNEDVIENVNTYTFNSCLNLQSIKMTGWINTSTFSNCQNLSQIYFLNAYGGVSITDTFSSVFATTPLMNSKYLGYYGSIYVPSKVLSYYQNHQRTSSYSERFVALPENFDEKYIYQYEYFNSSISQSDIRYDVSYILNSAFSNTTLSGFNSLEFSNVEVIGPYAFYSCKNLSELNVPKLKAIMSYGLYGTGLTSITLSNCEYIGSNTFYNCSNLSYVSVNNVKNIEQYTFQNCYSLKELHLSKVKYIEYTAFTNCSGIEVLDLPECYEIKGQNFNYITNKTLRYINLPNISIFTTANGTRTATISGTSTLSSVVDYLNIGAKNMSFYTNPFGGKTYGSFIMSNLSVLSFTITNCSINDLQLPNLQTINTTYTFSGNTINNIYLPNLKVLSNYTFYNVKFNMSELLLPNVNSIPTRAFAGVSLPKLIFNNVYYIDNYAFTSASINVLKLYNYQLNGVSYPFQAASINNIAIHTSQINFTTYQQFAQNHKLERLVFNGDIKSLSSYWSISSPFSSTPITNSTYLGYYGSIYVPQEYIENWRDKFYTIASRITTIEEHETELRELGLID